LPGPASPASEVDEVADDAILWRRIYPDWIVEDEHGQKRPSSHAFLDRRSEELSVHRAHLTDADTVLATYPDQSLVAFPASAVTALGYEVVPDPTEDDPSHAIITPQIKKRAHRRKLVTACEWVVL